MLSIFYLHTRLVLLQAINAANYFVNLRGERSFNRVEARDSVDGIQILSSAAGGTADDTGGISGQVNKALSAEMMATDGDVVAFLRFLEADGAIWLKLVARLQMLKVLQTTDR